jgi:hypothetical protein
VHDEHVVFVDHLVELPDVPHKAGWESQTLQHLGHELAGQVAGGRGADTDRFLDRREECPGVDQEIGVEDVVGRDVQVHA